MVDADFPLTTGKLAELLGVPERQIQQAVRRGVVKPRILGGRRLWTEEDAQRVAEVIGVRFRSHGASPHG